MIKHIVMWNIKDSHEGMTKKEILSKMKTDLMELKNHIPELLEIEVGLDQTRSERSYDILLYSVFNSMEGLQAYQVHPEHVKVGKFIKSVTEKAAAVDYEI